jgi:hypothetical protein
MRYWFDTEFVERGSEYPIKLVSIGIVAEDGREYYAQAYDGISAAIHHDWVRENVIPHLAHMKLTTIRPPSMRRVKGTEVRDGGEYHLETCGHDDVKLHPDCPWRSLDMLASDLTAFCDPEQYGKPEIWAYYADYDWVVLCQIFGRMIDLPKGWPMYCRDIKQLAAMLGNPKLPEQGKGEHHALADARWNKEAHSFLIGYGQAAGFPETMLAA